MAIDIMTIRQYALSFCGRAYQYGGDDPIGGFDCSGFISEILRSAGVVPYNFRESAQGIYSYLIVRNELLFNPRLGCIAFFGQKIGNITHIAFCLDDILMLEAGGGNPNTTSNDAAILRNAFVRVRPIKMRRDLLGFIYPFR